MERSASVVKAMLMVAYLDEPQVARRALNRFDNSRLRPMITVSDSNAASQVRNIVGNGALQALAGRVGMAHFATAAIWGETQITARDQTRFFLHIDRYIARRHHRYTMHMLANVVPSERWGIGEVAPTLREASEVAGRVAFFNEPVDLVVDGAPLARPVTPWSRR